MSSPKMTKQDVLRRIDEEKVGVIRLFFTDILGKLKSFAITPRELELALEEGMGFDGSSIEGFVRIHESDLIAKPDPATFRILPWKSADEKVCIMLADIMNPNGTHYEGDPRHVLRRVVEKAAAKGFDYLVGPELEYFYFKSPKAPETLDAEGYFDFNHHDAGTEMRKRTVKELEEMGIKVEYSHHEVAPSQHEIDLRYQEAMGMADITMLYRLTVREVARRYGYHASFMPKPIFGENGSGMHVHQSLFKGERNAFFEAGDQYHLSALAKSYMAGILNHVSEFSAVSNQWINSYKRLVPGYEAPVYISWGQRNRSALVRVPTYKPGKENATRIELRTPDPACNPYLTFAVMLAAGLKGVEEGYELPEPIEDDIFAMSSAQRRRRGIRTLPGDLNEATNLLARSSLMRETLGEHVFEKFIANKRVEWDRYRTHVTNFEIENYLPIL